MGRTGRPLPRDPSDGNLTTDREMTSGDGGSTEDSPAQGGGVESTEEQVMSEVHQGCPPNHSGAYISHFTISLPPQKERTEDGLSSTAEQVFEVDEDGDLILTRRTTSRNDSFVIKIQHHVTSSIPSVGLQVWRAELVLADFVLYTMHNSSKFDGIVAVELGAGTGLIGLLLARAANTVFITDHGDEVLGNCAKNVHLNAEFFHEKASVYVSELDWNYPWPPQDIDNPSAHKSYGWINSVVEELNRASLLVAADVIYNDDLTDAFFNILEVLMSSGQEKVLYLALEKRYNFTMDDLDIVANGYSHFRSYLKLEEDDLEEEEDNNTEEECRCSFVGRRINLDEIPRYVLGYDRGNDVEIFEIKYVNRNLNSCLSRKKSKSKP